MLTYPRPFRPGRRVSIVCVPWRTLPSPGRSASASAAPGRSCPTPLPIPASSPTRLPTKTPPTTTRTIRKPLCPPASRGDYRGASPCSPSPHGGEGPGDGPKPHHTWHYPCGFGPSWLRPGAPPPLELAPGEGWGGGNDSPTPPPTKCSPPSKYRPTRGLAPPRTRGLHRYTTPPAPPPPRPLRHKPQSTSAQLNTAGVLPGSVIPATARYSPSLHGRRGAGGQDHMLLTAAMDTAA